MYIKHFIKQKNWNDFCLFHFRSEFMYSITLVLKVKMLNIYIAYYIIYIALFVHDLQYKSVYIVHTTRICRFYWIILKLMTALEKNCFVRQMSYVTKHLIVIRPHPDFFSSLRCPNCYLKTYLAAVISQLGKFIDCCNNAKQTCQL